MRRRPLKLQLLPGVRPVCSPEIGRATRRGRFAGRDTAGNLGFGSLCVAASADTRQEVQNFYQGAHAGKDTSSMLSARGPRCRPRRDHARSPLSTTFRLVHRSLSCVNGPPSVAPDHDLVPKNKAMINARPRHLPINLHKIY